MNEMMGRIAKLAGVVGAAVVAFSLTAVAPPTMSSAFAADDKNHPGRKLYSPRASKGCLACHGKDGKAAILNYPNIAGQEERYMLEQMKDIKSGKRVGSDDPTLGQPRTQGMFEVMHLVDDQEMKDLANWLSSVEPGAPIAPEEPYDPARLAQGEDLYKKLNCKNCHGVDGDKPLRGHPYLAAQKASYLTLQMVDIRDGVRKNGRSNTMRGFIRRASDEDIQLMAEYLSQVPRSGN